MARTERNFIKGVMNKSVDERLLPNGEYRDAMNVRLGSTEQSEIGSVENSKGNLPLTTLSYGGQPLSAAAQCIGAVEDGARETIYWFVHDSTNPVSPTGKVDLVVSFNVLTSALVYHIVSTSVLNFNPTYLITGVNVIDDLLFWTDDFNAPRRINTTTSYPAPIAGVDQITNKTLNVIVQPPIAAPTIQLYNQPSQENYIETRFVAFAYRYKYADGEYSALSQFSDIAFEPEDYVIDTSNYLNGGMVNQFNSVLVSFNAGGNDVVGVDLCFKFCDDSIVRVIEKYDKSLTGWPANSTQTISFSNSKIYTVLGGNEILRLYDNVPRYAKAQTIMGNRLMYGNYVDGYNLIDANGNKCDIDFVAERFSSDIGLLDIQGTTASASYGLGGVITTVPSGQGEWDFTPIMNSYGLKKGSYISFVMEFSHYTFWGNDATVPPLAVAPPPQPPFGLEISITLTQDYPDAYSFFTSTEFLETVGTLANIQPVASCANGITATDVFNCSIVAPSTPLPGYTLKTTGINVPNQNIQVIAIPGSNVIKIQPLAAQYEVVGSPANDQAFEAFRVTFAGLTFVAQGDRTSLHSNRDYEAAIIYMDDYNRATTALVSQFNTIFVPCANSITKNQIKVTIPTNMLPPTWATRYKWAVKPSATTYETIYSSLFYRDDGDGSVWFKLEGENQLKVEVGDTYIVKRDTNGALSNCVDTVVLDKVSKPENFLGNGELPGVYMRLKPTNWAAQPQPNAIVGGETVAVTTKNSADRKDGKFPYLQYPLFEYDGANYINWDVPQGAVVDIYVEFYRENRDGCGGNCGASRCVFEASITASQDYPTFKDFWDGEAINVSTGVGSDCLVECQDDSGENANVYYNNLYDLTGGTGAPWYTDTAIQGTNQYQFVEDTNVLPYPVTPPQYLTLLGGTPFCTGVRKHSTITCQITITRADNTVIFETIPAEASPDLFYIGNETFDITGGYHQGNQQNQSAVQSGISILDNFNCYMFGNGVESYKIRDSLTGHFFSLGEQVTAVAAQDYKEADRYADITYSGVYNNESNVNKLNEFNLGIANFFACEESFGSIEKLAARETDVLTLQEDKISYVLAGKNLLSDSIGGGQIASIPEVLGKQIARIEEYGISHNPESYVEFGLDRFFTDVKRGAVIQLKGNPQAERLMLLSEMGMRSWFRDLFNASPNTQKLGGFDPYMNEYVLSSNDVSLPIEDVCLECGFSATYEVPTGSPLTLCVELGNSVGEFAVNYTVASTTDSENVEINTTYNAVLTGATINPPYPVTGTYNVTKATVDPTTATITIISNGGTKAVVNLNVECVDAQVLTIIPVCVTSDGEAGLLIHNQFNYTQGAYLSPTETRPIIFQAGAGDVVSDYDTLAIPQGTSYSPPDGSTVTMYCNKIGADDFVFNPAIDKFRWLRSNTLYNNNPADITALLTISVAAPIDVSAAPAIYSANFTMPATNDQYLYLIYDYRDITPIELCYSNVDATDACCDCTSCGTCQEFSCTSIATSLLGTCPLARTNTLWFSGNSSEPEVGDTLYTDSACTSLFGAGLNVWLGINAVNTDAIYVESGVVTNKSSCV